MMHAESPSILSTTNEAELHIPSHTVAQTDIETALQALEKVGRERIDAAAVAATQRGNEDEKRKLKRMQEKLQMCMNSLRENLVRMTESMPDDEYEALFQRSAQVDEVWNLDEDYSKNCNTTSSSDEVVEEEDTDYDTDMEEELFLDRDAYARVKDLRAKVREASERIGKLRQEIPRHATELIQSEIAYADNFRNECQQTPTKNLFNDLSDAGSTTDCITPGHSYSQPIAHTVSVDSATSEAMKDMEDSLHKLVSLINTIRIKLPEELDSFQSTMEVVDRYVSKVSDLKNLNEHGEYMPLNPVEKAMFSQETRHTDPTDMECADDNCLQSPQSRFFSYLATN